MTIRPYPEALKAAETANTPPEFKAVMDEITERLDGGGHAIAIDSASSLLKALTKSYERVHMS